MAAEGGLTLTRLEAVEAIQALKSRYWRGVDLKSPADVDACLADDIAIDFEGLPPYSDRASFMEMIRSAAAQPGNHMHLGRNPVIRLTGDESAKGVWDIFYQGVFAETRQIVQMSGTYEDRYIVERGGWRIAAMTMRQSGVTVRALDERDVARFVALPGGSTSADWNAPTQAEVT